MRIYWRWLVIAILLLLLGSTAQTRRQDEQHYPQDYNQLRTMVIQNRTDLNKLERHVTALENAASFNQSNTVRISVLEEQVGEIRRQIGELRTVLVTAIIFIISQLVAFLGFFIRYLLDRSKFIDKLNL